MNYYYPEYQVQWTSTKIAQCRDIALRLLQEVGLKVKHEKFVSVIKKHDGVKVVNDRVFLQRELAEKHFDIYLAAQKDILLNSQPKTDWSLSNDGFSISVIDIETDEVRDATENDLRQSIRLLNSFDIHGSYPCCPQNLPPYMRVLSTFKICYEESENIRPFDYLDQRQTPFLFDMQQVMNKALTININIPHTMAISEHDLDTFLMWYPVWKKNHNAIDWYSICDYPMIGINRPLTATGSVTAYLAQSFGAHVLFQLFDPEINMKPRMSAGMPTDLRSMNWAWGSPRMHLYHYLNQTVMPVLCGIETSDYRCSSAFMCSGSCSVDARSGMEKMSTALTAAMQGARHFSGAGNLAVDDLFSGVQLLLDVEIYEYIKETIEAYAPSAELMSTDNLYEMMRDCAIGGEEFYAHIETAQLIRNLMPSSARRPGEKMRSWLTHGQHLKNRLQKECLERIKNQPLYELNSAKKQELQKIYKRAEKELGDYQYS